MMQRFMLLVSHAKLAEGVASALEMLMGPRDNVFAFGMEPGESPEAFVGRMLQHLPGLTGLTKRDAVVVLGDIAGGAPLTETCAMLARENPETQFVAFGGLNLPMAISATMALADGLDLDAVRDAVLADGVDAVRQV